MRSFFVLSDREKATTKTTRTNKTRQEDKQKTTRAKQTR